MLFSYADSPYFSQLEKYDNACADICDIIKL